MGEGGLVLYALWVREATVQGLQGESVLLITGCLTLAAHNSDITPSSETLVENIQQDAGFKMSVAVTHIFL